LPFYEKHGYIVYGVLNDMPIGHKRYSLEKKLGPKTIRSADANRGTDSSVTLREITGETVVSICKLSDTLSAPQKKMVAPNAQSIAQAHYSRYAWFRAIYADETPVGFIMLYDNPEEKRYFLWRLMIAGPYQGLGYGEKAVRLLIEYVRTQPGAKALLVSCGEGEASPEGFYAKLGFQRTGEMLDDEVVMSLTLGAGE
jgi:diamine N-acetyltransferase